MEVSEYGEGQFYRLTGVKRAVFELIIEMIVSSRSGRGRRATLSVQDQLLLTLCYWREYRIQFHLPKGRPRAVSVSAKRPYAAP